MSETTTARAGRPSTDGTARHLALCCRAITGLVTGTVRPARPDGHFLSGLSDAGLPSAATTVQVQALPAITRPVPTPIVAEGVRRPRRIGIALTAFVVRHPKATFLVDPGVCTDVVGRIMPDLRRPLRTVVTPPIAPIDVTEGLRRAGLPVDRIDFAVPTHLHWDHVAGLLDLPGLPVLLHGRERRWFTAGAMPPVGGVAAALQGRPETSYELDGPPVSTFTASHDLFGDGSVVLVDLSGHTPGSVGVLLATDTGPVLLAGDAAWHGIQIERLRPKAAFPGLLVDEDRGETLRTLHRLHAARTRIRIVPTHDPEATAGLAR